MWVFVIYATLLHQIPETLCRILISVSKNDDVHLNRSSFHTFNHLFSSFLFSSRFLLFHTQKSEFSQFFFLFSLYLNIIRFHSEFPF